MALITAFSRAFRNPGTYQLSPTPVPVGLNHIDIVATRDSWPAGALGGDLIIFTSDISFDAGQTWQLLAGFNAPGGVFLDQNGNEVTQSGISVVLPQPANAARRIRATLTCTARFRTQVTADMVTV